MAGLMEAYAKWADGWSKVIAEASVPEVRYENRQARNWVTARLDYALIAIAAYLLLCVYGTYKKQQAARKARKEDKAAQAAAGLSDEAWAAKKQADAAAAKKAAGPRMTFKQLVQGFPGHVAKIASDPIKALQTLHNVIQVALSVFMGVSVTRAALGQGYGIVCNPFDVNEQEITWVTWVFYMSKLYDFVDTVFMVLRGKWGQFSFLHTYHHVSIFLTYWWVTNTAHTGDTWFPVLLNSLVHAVMYFYYLLTCFGYTPPWGKHLTMMQMTQFVVMMTQGVFILYWDCPFPHPTATYYVLYIGSMLLLFLQFFMAKYYSDAKKAAADKAKAAKLASESKKDM